MPPLVMKFGGTSVADLDRIGNAADKVERAIKRGNNVAVVVSAMAGKTNELVELVHSAGPFFDAREYDAVVSAGENIVAGLFALALQQRGVPARSWQGWQVPIRTDAVHGAARILEIPTSNLEAKFAEGMKAAVISGFQGCTPENRVATLGRGGSDASAVALAAAFGSERCEIYTDVEGVFTADPRIVSKASKLRRISYEEMLELSSLGAKVLQTRSVELAMRQKVRLCVLSSFSDEPGTLVCDEEEIMESNVVSGVAHSRDEAKLTIISVADRPGIAASIFGPLASAGVNVDMIVQNISEDSRTDITFSCPVFQVAAARKSLEEAKSGGAVRFADLIIDEEVCKVSVVGIGMRSHAGVAAAMFKALASEGINIKVISTSEIKISVLVDRRYMELAVQSLHDAFKLEKCARGPIP